MTAQASRFWTEILFSESLSLIAEQQQQQQNNINNNTNSPSSLLIQQLDELKEPNFDRYEKECEIINKFTLKEFQLFANQFLLISQSTTTKVTRRLLISQINSTKKSVIGGSSASPPSAPSPQNKNNLKYIDISTEKGPISTETI